MAVALILAFIAISKAQRLKIEKIRPLSFLKLKNFTIKVALFFQFDPSKPDFQKSRSLKKPDFWKKDHSHAKKSIITCNSFKWGMQYGPIFKFLFAFDGNNVNPCQLYIWIKCRDLGQKNKNMAFFGLRSDLRQIFFFTG